MNKIDEVCNEFFEKHEPDYMEKFRNDEHYNQMSKDNLKNTIDSLTDRLYWLIVFEIYVKTMNPELYVRATLFVDKNNKRLTYKEILIREENNE